MEHTLDEWAKWLLTFIIARDLASSRLVVEAHPEIMDILADDVLTYEAEVQEDEAVSHMFLWRRDLLRRCRAVGIATTYEEYANSDYPWVSLAAVAPKIMEEGTSHQHLGAHPASDKLQALLKELEHLTFPDDLPRQIEIYQQALTMVDRENAELWAALQYTLAGGYAQNRNANREEAPEQAIFHYQQALEVYTYESFPFLWASIQHNLGTVYSERTRGEAKDNLEQTIICYQRALEVYTREKFPQEWASSHDGLGLAYIKRVYGDRANNLELAIVHYQQALEVYTRVKFPQEWADIQGNLGNVYSDRVYEWRVDSLEEAITHYQQALEIYTLEGFPRQWAHLQNNLGRSYRSRIRGERADNLEQAIAHHQRALQVRTRDSIPEDWAATQYNLGNGYSQRIRGERADNLEQAIAHYQQALEIYTQEDFPEQWAMIHNNLGLTYLNRIRGERTNNLEQAIANFQQCLEVYTRDAFPKDWADIQDNLGGAYDDRILGERAHNIEQALGYYQRALEIRTREAFPEYWAKTQHNLGEAYSNRIHGERADNLEQAIAHYQQALEIRSREDYPEEWAWTQNNLANVYLNRIRGERADNLELAIRHCQQALKVRTRESFPEQWADTENNLGNAYIARIRGEQADNLEQALEHFQRSLESRTREGFPEKWAATQNNMASAYSHRIHGGKADNLEDAIIHYRLALEIYTRETFPELWAGAQLNLGSIYLDRLLGEPIENLKQAMSHYSKALQVFSKQAYPERWANIQTDLGRTYGHPAFNEEPAYRERAIGYYHHALEIYSRDAFPLQWAWTQHSLGITFAMRTVGEQLDNRKKAIKHYQRSLEIYTPDQFPDDCRRALRNLGNLYFRVGSWETAYSLFARAIEVSETQLAAAYTEVGRTTKADESSELYTHVAYCLLQLGRPAEALLQLELGKTRLLTEALAFDNTGLTVLTNLQRQTLLEARRSVRDLEAEMRLPADTPARRSNAVLGQLLHRARADLKHIIETIRALHPEFMPAGLNLLNFLALIPQGGALVVPLVTSQGGALFVLPHAVKKVDNEQVLLLPSLTQDIVSELLRGHANSTEWGGWMGAYFNFHGARRHDPNRALGLWKTAIETSTRRLWEVLIAPLHERLAELGLGEGAPIVLIPQGTMGLLPLHAAWREVRGKKRAFIDDYTISYAPSAYTLHISYRRIQDRGRQERTLLAVINPTFDLPYTPLEGLYVATLFDRSAQCLLLGDEAKLKAVVTEATGRAYLHFSCHGFYNWRDVMRSGLVLADGQPITLAEIISPRFDLSLARLVALSACETGLTEFQQAPNEYIGLPAGFLQAGAPAVVSTLWMVEDFSSALLMEAFYQRLLLQGQSIAQALRGAQCWLRDLVRDEVLAHIKGTYDMVKNSIQAEQLALLNKTLLVRLQALEGILLEDYGPDECPFAHPYYWAAFLASGAV